MAFTSEQLLNILAFDSEEYRILTFEERCIIHKERARQAHGFPPNDFDPELHKLLIKTCVDIRQRGWTRPNYWYFEETGQIKKRKLN